MARTSYPRKAKPKATEMNVSCGVGNCVKLVRFGIECSSCRKYFHPRCARLSTSQIKKLHDTTDSLWFCIECSSLPLVRCITVLAQKCDRLSKIVEQATAVK
ncbi:unnamed protein product, partial [Dicrocoelium dendriticum]